MPSNDIIVYCGYGALGLMGIVALFSLYMSTHKTLNTPIKHSSPYNHDKNSNYA